MISSKGHSQTPVYDVWSAMRDRCNNPNNHAYSRYGGRGIKVCKSWDKKFINFLRDMGHRPSDSHSIERINTNKGYTKSNCKWATVMEQASNRRNNVWYEYGGKKMILQRWIEAANTTRHQFTHMLKTHSFEETVSFFEKNPYVKKVRPPKKYIKRKRDWDNYTIPAAGLKLRPILQKSKEGILIKEWRCASEAEDTLGLSASAINNVLCKRTKTSGGFIWEYAIKSTTL